MEVIKNKLKKSYKHKKKWAKSSQIEAYRLYDREIPDYPYIIDIYGNYALIYTRTKENLDSDKNHHLDHIVQSLLDILDTQREHIIIKERKVQKRNEKYSKSGLYDKKEKGLSINEHQAKLEVNLWDYIDTGLFLDHRPLRQIIFNNIKKNRHKRFLNLFSYTCSVSVFAALSGATTTSIDLSTKYLDWGKRNFVLNNLDLQQHFFIQSDILEYLKGHNLKKYLNNKFDIIFLDPPTFSNSKKMQKHFDIEKDQYFLIESCMNILESHGILYFSNNLRSFKLGEDILKNYSVKNITAKSIPSDFKDQKIHHLFEIKHKKNS